MGDAPGHTDLMLAPEDIDAALADTPAPIATPEEVAERIADAHIRRLGTPRSASLRDDIAAAIAAERSTSNAEIERLTRERDAAQERGSKMMWQVQAAEARVATLTAEVGRMREAAVRLVGAAFNEMAVKGLPLECARVSTLGQALATLGVPNDERCRSANEWTTLLEAALSPEPEAKET